MERMTELTAEQHPQSVFLDETAFTAFMNPSNPHYVKARSLFLDLDDLDRHFITTNYILFDVHDWLRNEFDYVEAEYFLNAVDKAAGVGKLSIISGSQELELESRRLLLERPDLKYSLSEALTAIVMSTYRIRHLLTFNPQHLVLSKLDKQIKIIPTIW
jgi:predicted nucleic acid-binding protein